MMSRYRIIIADDHLLMRQGLKRIIMERRGLEVVGEASDGMELLGLVKKLEPDMVILDISMPKLRGIEAAREIRLIRPSVQILILSMHSSEAYLEAALAAGARGYLLKNDPEGELFAAIRTIRQGKTYVSHAFRNVPRKDHKKRGPSRRTTLPGPLTHQERVVLKLISEGRTSKEVAEMLFISFRTVEHHRLNIGKKLGVKRTAELVRYAVTEGLVTGTDARPAEREE